jgi:hypothetical protein
MSLALLKTKARAFARVDVAIVSQTDTGAGGANLDSQETLAILDALKQYSLHRPRRLSIQGAAITTGYDQDLSTFVSGWTPDSHQVVAIWFPTDAKERNELQGSDWVTYNNPATGDALRFLTDVPGVDWWMDYTAPHVANTTEDTLSAEAPGDVDAFCHLAASMILQQAANHYARQSSSTISVDAVQTDKQSQNYAQRAKEERQLFLDHVAMKAKTGSVRVDWGRPAKGQADRLWHNRRYQ